MVGTTRPSDDARRRRVDDISYGHGGGTARASSSQQLVATLATWSNLLPPRTLSCSSRNLGRTMAATKPPPKIQKESIWRTLPRACFGLIAAVVLDVVAMLGYATLLLMDGASPSAFYFAAVVLTGAFILVFFTMSAVLRRTTIELLATVCVGTCVTIMVFWLRLGGGNLDQVQRTTERGGMMDDLFPDPAQKQFVLTLGALATQGTIQIAFVVFGYLSYKDFGWRIFKLFGTDLGMRQVYETYLWFKALLKMDALLAGLNVAAGFAFFYFKEGESWRVVMIVGVGANLLWVCLAFAAVKLEKSLLVRVLMPPALLMPGYLAYKAYTIFYNEQAARTVAYTGTVADLHDDRRDVLRRCRLRDGTEQRNFGGSRGSRCRSNAAPPRTTQWTSTTRWCEQRWR